MLTNKPNPTNPTLTPARTSNNDKAPTNNSNVHKNQNQLHNNLEISIFFQTSTSLDVQSDKSLDILYEYADTILSSVNKTKKETDPIDIKNELLALVDRIPPSGKNLEDLSLKILFQLCLKISKRLVKMYCEHHGISFEIVTYQKLRDDLALSLRSKFRPLTKMYREQESKYSYLRKPISDADIYE